MTWRYKSDIHEVWIYDTHAFYTSIWVSQRIIQALVTRNY